jgi:hypothetical protein
MRVRNKYKACNEAISFPWSSQWIFHLTVLVGLIIFGGYTVQFHFVHPQGGVLDVSLKPFV